MSVRESDTPTVRDGAMESASQVMHRILQRIEDEGVPELPQVTRSVNDSVDTVTRCLTRAGIPKGLHGCTLDQLTETAGNRTALRLAREFLAMPVADRKGLCLEGKAGVGKTHIAAAMACILAQRGESVLFRSTCDLLLEIKQTYDNDAATTTTNESALLRKFGTVDVLVLDDLGAERTTDWALQMFYMILNRRCYDRLPVIVTSNLEVAEIARIFGERIMSRLLALCRIARVEGDDYRRRR